MNRHPLAFPLFRALIDELPPGRALDAACGTGRWSAYLAARGHRVVGVDTSPDMLDRARAKVPAATFARAALTALPLPGDAVDLVVCALALPHVPDLRPVFAVIGGGPVADRYLEAAVAAAYENTPAAIIWEFRLPPPAERPAGATAPGGPGSPTPR